MTMPLFDAFLIWKKVAHSIRRTVVGKRKLHVQNYNWAIDALPKAVPPIIWMYWDKPLDQAPPFVTYAIDSWKSKNPGWTVRVLDDNSLHDWIDVPQAGSARKIQGRSDAIRLALLQRYGGLWIDATCACVRPLDEWLPPLMTAGFFAFPDSYPGRIIQSWFLAAAPDNYLVDRWARLALRYYSKKGKLLHYFWVMHLFEYMLIKDRKAARIWASVPKLSAKGPLLPKRIVTQRDLAELIPANVDLSAIPVLKISSGTKTVDPELMEALAANRDIDLRKMADNVIAAAENQRATPRSDRL